MGFEDTDALSSRATVKRILALSGSLEWCEIAITTGLGKGAGLGPVEMQVVGIASVSDMFECL
jgi:hypothetical protein